MRGSLARGPAILALAVLVCCARPARAHSPVEIAQVVAYGERGVVLAPNRGLILGQLAPRAFSLLCVESKTNGLPRAVRAAR
jgi:hypothetical protein